MGIYDGTQIYTVCKRQSRGEKTSETSIICADEEADAEESSRKRASLSASFSHLNMSEASQAVPMSTPETSNSGASVQYESCSPHPRSEVRPLILT